MAPEVRFELTTVRASIENADVSRSRVARLEFCRLGFFAEVLTFQMAWLNRTYAHAQKKKLRRSKKQRNFRRSFTLTLGQRINENPSKSTA